MSGLNLKQNLVILHPHLLYPGGASKYMLEVSTRLADKGISVIVVLTRYDKRLTGPYKKIKFIKVGGPNTGEISFWLTLPLFIFRLKKILDQIPNKVLFPQIFPPVWWAATYKFFSPKTKVVWMCQEPSAFIHSRLVIKSLKQPGKAFAQIFNPALKIVDRVLVKKIDFIIANSHYGASLVQKIYQRKADLVAYPSVDPKIFKPTKNKKKYIFTVSRLDKQKNIDLLIRAYLKLPKTIIREYKLLIGGTGNEEKTLKNMVANYNLQGRIQFLGKIEEKKLPKYYAESALAVFLGEDEPFGIIPVEAMSCGTPVVALKTGGLVESVPDGKTGVLLSEKDEQKLAETISYLLKSQKKLKGMAQNSRQHVLKNFSWDKTANKIHQFLKKQIFSQKSFPEESQVSLVRRLARQFSWQSLILLGAVLVVGLPSLFVNWMIIDDGIHLLVTQKISSLLSSFDWKGLWEILLEKETGRFRPGFWASLWLIYLVAGKNPFLHHLVNFSISSATAFLVYSIIKILTLSSSAALLAGLIFVLAPFNVENWYRLGTAEPKMTFLLALSLYFLIKNIQRINLGQKVKKSSLFLTILPLLLVYFLKETFFVFLLFAFFLLGGIKVFKTSKKQRFWLRLTGTFFIFNLILAAASLTISLLIRQPGSYSAYYKVALPNILSTGRWYLLLLIKPYFIIFCAFLLSFLISWFSFIKERRMSLNRYLQLAFLVGFASVFVTLLPWLIPMGRYLEPALLFVALIVGLEMDNLLKLGLSKWRFFFFKTSISLAAIKSLFFIMAFAILLLFNGLPFYNYVRDTIIGQRNTVKILALLAAQAPKNGKIFWNLKEWEGTVELIIESNIFLHLVHNRPDLEVKYLNGNNFKTLEVGDMVMSAIVNESDKLYRDDDLMKNKNLKVVTLFSHEIETISFHPLQSIRIIKSILFKRPLPMQVFFQRTVVRPQWRLYQVSAE